MLRFHLHEILRLVRFIETESRTVVIRNGEWFNGYKVSVWDDDDKKVLEVDNSDDCTAM